MALMRFLLCLFFVFSFSSDACARAHYNSFQSFLNSVSKEALAEGVSSATVKKAFNGLEVSEKAITLDKKQPEKKITFQAYSEKILHPLRVKTGKTLLHRHWKLLKRIEKKEGVAPEIVVALWGIESSFGANMGGFNIIQTLATMAYEGRRADFFRRELLAALKIMDQEKMSSHKMKGSWAGAMGQCQFMPTTYLHYAVDGDGDGKRDIWRNEADILASIAHYLAKEGWRSDLIWGREVSLKSHIPTRYKGLQKKDSLDRWHKKGVRRSNGHVLPTRKIKASLIEPDGSGGRSFLVYDNFRALMRWNRSTYFATSVGLLADRLVAPQ